MDAIIFEKNFSVYKRIGLSNHHFKFNGTMPKDSLMLVRIAFPRAFRLPSRFALD